jgi:hypothetical protein
MVTSWKKNSRAMGQLGKQTYLNKQIGTLQDQAAVAVLVNAPTRSKKRCALTNLDDTVTRVLGTSFVDTAEEVNQISVLTVPVSWTVAKFD